MFFSCNKRNAVFKHPKFCHNHSDHIHWSQSYKNKICSDMFPLMFWNQTTFYLYDTRWQSKCWLYIIPCQLKQKRCHTEVLELASQFAVQSSASIGWQQCRTSLALCVNPPEVGVTKAPFVNFSVRKIFNPAKAHVRIFKSHPYLTDVTQAKLQRHLPN